MKWKRNPFIVRCCANAQLQSDLSHYMLSLTRVIIFCFPFKPKNHFGVVLFSQVSAQENRVVALIKISSVHVDGTTLNVFTTSSVPADLKTPRLSLKTKTGVKSTAFTIVAL